MKFKKDLLEEIMCLRVGRTTVDGSAKLVHEDPWTSDGKYEHASWVFDFRGRFFTVHDSRCGSYHTDYWRESEDWDDEVDCDEVEPVLVTKTEWRPI